MEVGVLRALDVTAGEAHGEQQLGVDAVLDLLRDPGLGVVAARVDVLVAAPLALLVGRPPAQASQPKPRASKPSHTQASPSGRRSTLGTWSRYFWETRVVQMSPGPFRWPSAEISLYSRALPVLSCQCYKGWAAARSTPATQGRFSGRRSGSWPNRPSAPRTSPRRPRVAPPAGPRPGPGSAAQPRRPCSCRAGTPRRAGRRGCSSAAAHRGPSHRRGRTPPTRRARTGPALPDPSARCW